MLSPQHAPEPKRQGASGWFGRVVAYGCELVTRFGSFCAPEHFATAMHQLKFRTIACLISAFIAVSGFSVSFAGGINTNVYLLDLTGKGTLKEVFAAGLRPKRWDSSLEDECLVE